MKRFALILMYGGCMLLFDTVNIGLSLGIKKWEHKKARR
jgi:hypothetical protein